MTDRIANLTVVLVHDMRDDDVQEVVKALKMVRGVGRVIVGEPRDLSDYVAQARAKDALQEKMRRLLADD